MKPRIMSRADESLLIRIAKHLPGAFGALTAGELVETYGAPSDAQLAGLWRYVELCADGRFRSRAA